MTSGRNDWRQICTALRSLGVEPPRVDVRTNGGTSGVIVERERPRRPPA